MPLDLDTQGIVASDENAGHIEACIAMMVGFKERNASGMVRDQYVANSQKSMVPKRTYSLPTSLSLFCLAIDRRRSRGTLCFTLCSLFHLLPPRPVSHTHIRRHMLEPVRPEATTGVTRQGVVLTDLQSLLDCQ